MKKILLNITETLLTIIIILLCITSVLQNNPLKNKQILNYNIYLVENSLTKEIKNNDIVLVRKKYNNPQKDDIIIYKDNLTSNKLIAKKLNNIENETLNAESLYGKIEYKFILLSLISKTISNKTYFVICLLIPVILLMIIEFVNISKERKRKFYEEQMQQKMEELNKIKVKENDKELKIAIENDIKEHLETISSAKRDIDKIDLLEETIQIPLEEIQNQISLLNKKLNKTKIKKTKKDDDLDKTIIISNTQDIKLEIKEELENKKKKNSKEKNKSTS